MNTKHYQLLASISLIALIFLCLAWEGWLAPLRPGGSWMILKGALLMPALFGILRGKRYTYKWLSLFLQFYLMEGLLRATTEHGPSQILAVAEVILAFTVFAAIILFIRSTRAPQHKE